MNEEKIRTIIMDTVIILAVGVQIVLLFDDATNGDFTRELGTKFVKLRGRIQEAIKREQFFRKNVGRTIWDAMETINRNTSSPQPGGIDSDSDQES